MPLIQEINKPTEDPGELRLKIRSMNGRTVYLAYVSADNTVEYLYHLLDTAMLRKRKHISSYKIIIIGLDRISLLFIVTHPFKKVYTYIFIRLLILFSFTSRKLDRIDVPLKNYGIDKDTVLHLVND